MPLRITDPQAQVAVLNRWAEDVESQLKKAHAKTAATNQKVVSIGSSVEIQVNGVDTAAQNKLNLVQGSGATITTDANGNVTISAGGGDGLTHGTTPWETDPSFVSAKDDFFSTITGGVSGRAGELFWQTIGASLTVTTTNVGDGFGSGILGTVGLSPSATTANAGGALYWGSAATNSWDQYLPLLDYPGWHLSWVFRLSRQSFVNPSTNAFDTTKLSTYIGLSNITIPSIGSQSAQGRPMAFIGCRFDTDPTAPAISDTTWHLEAFANEFAGVAWTVTARNNTQGNHGGTFDTGIVVANDENNWHRLDISCTTAGVVTVTLDGVGTTFTITPVTQTLATSGSSTILLANGIAQLNNPAGVPTMSSCYKAPGSIVTIGGFANGAGASGWPAYNGTYPILTTGNTSYTEFILSKGALTGGAAIGNYTVTVLPSLLPFANCYNDSQGTAPATGSRMLQVDFFGFIWNPALRTSGGTPNSSKPRYW